MTKQQHSWPISDATRSGKRTLFPAQRVSGKSPGPLHLDKRARQDRPPPKPAYFQTRRRLLWPGERNACRATAARISFSENAEKE
jgi:hypothetical protein